MNRPVDEKIVKMSLDNDQFKNSVKETVGAFDGINKAAANTDSINLQNLANSAKTIEKRFSTMGVVVASIINDIVRRTIDMGTRLASAITQPLVEGGKKRALNLEQAKFQFEGLGMDVEKTMNSALDAVKGTAFGLDEAAVIAAQFGATGMEAGEDMTAALTGISGVAAMTGSSYSDIGQVFATVAGNGRLMGNDLLRLGSRGVNAAATLGDAMNITEQEVRELVTQGEISFEMFAEAMNNAFGEHAKKANETYAGSLANVGAALSRIGAEIYTSRHEDLKDVFNAITPVIDDLFDALQPLIVTLNNLTTKGFNSLISVIERIDLEKFVELGGITNILEVFLNMVNFGKTIMGAFSDALSRVFPGSFMDSTIRITELFRDLSRHLVLTDETAEKITTVFQGIFAVFQTVATIAWELGSALLGIEPKKSMIEGVLDFAVAIAEMAINFNDAVQEGNWLTEAVKTLANIIVAVSEAIATLVVGTLNLTQSIGEKLAPAVEWLKGLLEPLKALLGDALGDDPLSAENILGGATLFGIIAVVQRLYDMFLQAALVLEGFTLNISQTFRRLGTALGKFIGEIKYNTLMKIAISIGILAISLKVLDGLDVASIAKGITALASSMAILMGGMAVIDKMTIRGPILAGLTVIALATAVTIMASALKKMSDLNPQELAVGIGGLAAAMAVMVAGMAGISALSGKIKVGSIQFVALATSIVILTQALKTLTDLDTKDMFISIGALGLIFAALAGFLALTKGAKIGPGTALGIMGIATSMIIMAEGIEKIGQIDKDELIKGLAAMAVILLEIALFSKIAGGGNMLLAATGVTILSGALLLIMVPIRQMSQMSWEELAKGIVGLAGALGTLAIIGALASSSILGAIGITAMATAMLLLVPPIKMFSSMSWGAIATGIGGLVVTIAALAGTAMLLSPAVVPMLSFSAALLAIGAAVALAGAGIALFGTGLASLAGLTAGAVTAIIGALGLLIRGLGSLIIDIVQFVVDLGMALIGGLGDLIPGLIIVATDIIMELLEAMRVLLPEFYDVGYDVVIGILEAIEEKGPELQMQAGETMVAMVEGMADAISKNRTPLVDAFVRLMGEVILVVIEAGTSTIEALFGWLPGVEGAMEKVGETATDYVDKHFGTKEVVDTKGDEVVASLNNLAPRAGGASELVARHMEDGLGTADTEGVADGKGKGLEDSIYGWVPGINNVSTDVATNMISGLDTADTAGLGDEKGNDLVSSFGSHSTNAYNTGYDVANEGKKGADTVSLNPTGSSMGADLVSGINSKKSSSRTAGSGLGSSAKSGASGHSLYGVGVNFGNGFANGINSTSWFVRQRSSSIANTAVSTVNRVLHTRSPSRVMEKTGGFFGEGFGIGIGKKVREVGSRAKDMAKTAVESMRDSLIVPDIDDNVIHFRVEVDDDELNFDDLPEPDPIPRPFTELTTSMANSARSEMRQNENKRFREERQDTREENDDEPTPVQRVIQLVTPDKREVARWVVDDVTDFQEIQVRLNAPFQGG